MSSLISALNANGVLLGNAASNMANLNTEGYRPLRTDLVEGPNAQVTPVTSRPYATDGQEGPGVDLAQEIGTLIRAEHGFEACLRAIDTREEMLDDLMQTLT